MFDALGIIMKGFIYIWMMIIGAIPNAFMAGLTLGVVATVITYFIKRRRSSD